MCYNGRRPPDVNNDRVPPPALSKLTVRRTEPAVRVDCLIIGVNDILTSFYYVVRGYSRPSIVIKEFSVST